MDYGLCTMTPVSLIITCEEEQQQQLMRLLPDLLTMQYDGEYEVIVVDKMHDKDLAEWLEGMEACYPHLCHTFCSRAASTPQKTSRKEDFIHRLAFTLGAKAANYDWLVFLSAGVGVPGGDWLTRLTASCGDDVDVVLGKTGRKHRWDSFKDIFRRKFSIFHPTSSIILCRRSLLLQPETQIPKKRITRLPL